MLRGTCAKHGLAFSKLALPLALLSNMHMVPLCDHSYHETVEHNQIRSNAKVIIVLEFNDAFVDVWTIQ